MPGGLFSTNLNTVLHGKTFPAVINAIPSAQGDVIVGKPESWYMSFLPRRWVLEISSLIRAQERFWISLSHTDSIEVI